MRHYLGDSISRTFGSSFSRNRSDGAKGHTAASETEGRDMRQSGMVPVDNGVKRAAVRKEVEVKPSRETMDGGNANFYHETSSSPSRAPSEHDQQPIRSVEEYEAYAMRQLSRHAYSKSRPTRAGSESAGQDWSDPRRRWEADNAV